MDTVIVTKDIGEVVSALSGVNIFSVDLETTGLNPHDSRMLLVQIGLPDGRVYIYPIHDDSNITGLGPFFGDSNIKKIFQRGKFDQGFFLYHNRKFEFNNLFDTHVAEKVINSDSRTNSLENLALKYTGTSLNKEIRKSFINMKGTDFTQEQLEYAAQDVSILFPIYEAQKEKIQAQGVERVAQLEFDLTTVIADMELAGVPIDVPKWKKILEDHRVEHETSKSKMFELLYDDNPIDEQLGLFHREPMNLNSPKQLKEIFAKIGIDLETTNEREIAMVNHPAARELLEYRRLQKILSSYGETFLDQIHPFTGRIHADFDQIGTATGRFSCRNPNLQQMPDEFRQCVSLSGYKVVVADYSQIELRILGELSKDKRFIEAFVNDIDLHTNTASIMFNTPLDKVTKDQRFIAKTINFGIAYGMGPNKLSDILNAGKPESQRLPLHRVKAIFNKYRDTYRDVIRWLQEAGDSAYRQGYSTTMMGRRRYYNPPTGDDIDFQIAGIKRQGANSPIQGTNADITKLALLDVRKVLREYNFRADIILQVHDEIVVLAHKSQAEAVKEVLEDSMIKSAEKILKTVPVKVDSYINTMWRKG
jgi:DNA polymerase I-like protein with 3'-5' exonuclease and polymerase domains